MDLNRIELIGRVGKDPEHAKENGPAKFSIATSYKYKDRDGALKESETQWHNIIVWGKMIDLVMKYVKKGSQLFVSGRMQYQKYKTKEGVDKIASMVVMNEMILLGHKGGGNTQPDSSEPAQPQSYDNGQEISIEDIPF